MTPTPLVSVIIPAFRAAATLRRAVGSVLASGLPADQLEIVIASDDGQDYAALLPRDWPLRFTRPGPIQSGPGAARNRALALARGAFVGFLDADDAWGPGYLAAALPLAASQGLVFAPTQVERGNEVILGLGRPGGRLSLAQMAQSGASFHPLVRRGLAGPFRARTAQDIFHSCELLGLAGGGAALSRVPYRLRLSPGSATRQSGFRARLRADYSAYIADLDQGNSRCPAHLRAAAARVFRAKLALDRAFRASGESCYYGFLAARLAAPPLPALARTGAPPAAVRSA